MPSWTAAAQTDSVTLAVAGRSNATPWIAAAGAHVAVVWTAATDTKAGDVFVAVSADHGKTFGQPVRVNATAGEARVSGEIAPRVALRAITGAAPEVTVLWNARAAVNAMRMAKSRDGGRTFQAAQTLQAANATGDRGWGALTLDNKGAAHAIWLDHRGLAEGGTHAQHKGEHDGVAMAQKSGIYYSSAAGGERELFKGVCYCCKTALAAGPSGELYAAWRHVFAGNMRDMGFTVSRDGGRTFAPMIRVNQDGWSIQGCPDDGPAMAADSKGTVHLVWPTVIEEQGVILYATSRDGRSFTAPVRLPNLGGPKPSHPFVAADAAGRAFVAWDESKDGVRSAAVAPVDGSRAPELFGPASSYPVLAAVENGLIAAWTSGPVNQTVIKVKRIIAK